MVRISIPQCWSALLQSLRGMGLGMRVGEARGREALLEGGGRDGGWGQWVRGRGGTAWQLNPPRPVY